MPETPQASRFPKWSVLVAVLLIAVGVGIGYWLTPTRIVTIQKEPEVVVVEKPVTKYVYNPYEGVRERRLYHSTPVVYLPPASRR